MNLLECGRRTRDELIYSGPVIGVQIGLEGFSVPFTGPHPALVDTGATESCIDSQIANKLGLPIIDEQPMAGASGEYIANIHLGEIHLPVFNVTIEGAFAAVDLIAGGSHYHALIGRTFLANFTMQYEGSTGRVTITPTFGV